ncbi:MAG: hypothetical protein AAGI17_11675 [Planctomycetota bacterium]
MMTSSPNRLAAAARRGFTIAELFVVVLIASVVLIVAIPAVDQALDSAERSRADNAIGFASQAARDLATLDGVNIGVFFLDEPGVGTRIVIARQVATLEEPVAQPNAPIGENPFVGLGTSTAGTVRRGVFVPIRTTRTEELPAEWAVAGFAPPNSIDAGWYDSPTYGEDPVLDPAVRALSYWLLPESHYYDQSLMGASTAMMFTPRQTFMLLFEGESGRLINDQTEALLLDPRPSAEDRAQSLSTQFSVVNAQDQRPLRVDLAENLDEWVRSIVDSPNLDSNTIVNDADARLRRALLGNYSHDTVLARPVTRLAMFKRSELLSGLYASRVKQGTPYATRSAGNGIEFANGSNRATAIWRGTIPTNEDIRLSITDWINGYEAETPGQLPLQPARPTMPPNWVLAQSGAAPVDTVTLPRARILAVQPTTGQVTEVRR